MQAISIPEHWLYPATLADATLLQKELAHRVVREDELPTTLRYVAGMDVSSNWRDPEAMIYASCVVLDCQTLQVVAAGHAHMQQKFPYIPGFLGFREAPALVQAFAKLAIKPDLILVDGHGISHPRGLGIASHMGVLLDIPTVGVAKSILIGKPATELAPAIGSTTPLLWQGNTLAKLLRSKTRCNPLIIATGHKVSLETSLRLVQSYLKGYRLPEPTRQAHLAANVYRRDISLA
jgi:deoxyribonuclease V